MLFLLLWAVSMLPSIADAAEVRIAVAANFIPAARELIKRFEALTSHTLVASYGSSGALYAQIRNGAPFEVFLSADIERPRKLEEEKLTVAGSRFTYAIGKLVLWSPKSSVVDKKGTVLKHGAFKKLALADPKTAPYGAAAREALQYMKLWDGLRSKLVQGVDVGQTYQFVSSGNAQLGFVAYSQILTGGKIEGSAWLVPQEYYHPIRQQAVMLSRGKNNGAARAFLDFLKSKEAVGVIQAHGYEVR